MFLNILYFMKKNIIFAFLESSEHKRNTLFFFLQNKQVMFFMNFFENFFHTFMRDQSSPFAILID